MVKQVSKLFSIIIPIFNEEENLPILINEILEVMKDNKYSFEVILIDDGSRDRSWEVMEGLAQKHKELKLIGLKRNFGQTPAIMAGMEQASGEFLVMMDGDLQNDPADIPLLFSKIKEGFDIVSGWRKDRQDKAITRKVPSWVANWIIRKVSGVNLHDLGCSLKIYRRSVMQGIKLYGEMHRFIPIHAHWLGAKITEQVVNHRSRKHGQSKYGLERVMKVFLDIIFIKFFSSYIYRPIHFFGKLGIYSAILSIISFLGLLYHKFIIGTSFIRSPLILLTVLFIILSIMTILIGLLAEILVRILHEQRSFSGYVIEKKVNFTRSGQNSQN